MRRQSKKQRKTMALLLVILAVTIGYALLSTTLKINGTAGIKKNTWDIHWENVVPNQASTITTDTPTITENATKVSYEVTLELPGDYYEFDVDAVNSGSINGEITKIEHKVFEANGTTPATLPSYINYSVYYKNTTTEPAIGDKLYVGEKQTYTIRIEYDEDAETLPGSDITIKVIDEITYGQAEDETEQTVACAQLQQTAHADNGTDGYVIVEHGATDKTTALTDYRFMGSNPNNYVYFNCTNDADYSTCETWRIIGCTSDKSLKLIKETPISGDREYGSISDYPEANWSNASLKTYLNGDYYNSLSNTAKSKIIERNWYTSGPATASSDTETVYAAERSNDVVATGGYNVPTQNPYKGKVGLMYASDYGFASNTCHRTSPLSFYYECNTNNWLYSGNEEWTITPVLTDYYAEPATEYAAAVSSGGSIEPWWAADDIKVRPVVYLKPGVALMASSTSGTLGSTQNKYLIRESDWILVNPGAALADQKWEYWENGAKLANTSRILKNFHDEDKIYHFNGKGYLILGWHKFNGKLYYSSLDDVDGNGYVDGDVFHDGPSTVTYGGGVTGGTGTFEFGPDGECTSPNCANVVLN